MNRSCGCICERVPYAVGSVSKAVKCSVFVEGWLILVISNVAVPVRRVGDFGLRQGSALLLFPPLWFLW